MLEKVSFCRCVLRSRASQFEIDEPVKKVLRQVKALATPASASVVAIDRIGQELVQPRRWFPNYGVSRFRRGETRKHHKSRQLRGYHAIPTPEGCENNLPELALAL